MAARALPISPSASSVAAERQYEASLMNSITAAEAMASATMSGLRRMTVAMRIVRPRAETWDHAAKQSRCHP